MHLVRVLKAACDPKTLLQIHALACNCTLEKNNTDREGNPEEKFFTICKRFKNAT